MNDVPTTDVWAVLVCYNGGLQLNRTVGCLLSQVDRVVIVDNASAPDTKTILDGLVSGYDGKLDLIANSSNRGLAAALNQGVSRALRGGSAWVLTMDQDSELGPGMIAEMLRGYAELGAAQARVAMLAPAIVDARDGHRLSAQAFAAPSGGGESHSRSGLIPVDLAYTSGSMVRAEVFASVGQFREDFFIDQVDFEFCLRVRSKGFEILMSPRAELYHRLGSLRIRKFAGRSIRCTTYAAVRHYYCARNKIAMFKSVRDWRFIRRQAVVMMKDVARIALFEEFKLRKAALFLAGVFDGLRGKMGQCTYVK